MSKKSVNSGYFAVPIHSSKLLIGITLLAYCLGIISLIMSCHPALGCLGALMLGYVGVKNILLDCLRLEEKSIILCQQITCTTWRLTNRIGKHCLAKIKGTPVRSRWLSIMIFQKIPTLQQCTVIVAFDALDRKKYTQQYWLRRSHFFYAYFKRAPTV